MEETFSIRKIKSTMDIKKWKIFHFENCQNCGDAVEVFSECPEEEDTEAGTLVADGEEVRCVAGCGFVSSISVDETASLDDNFGVARVQDGNIDELETD